MREVEFSYGCLSPALEEQAKKQGFTLSKAEGLERSREAITWLMFEDVLTDSQKSKAFQRLHKQVVKNLKLIKSNSELVKEG